MTIRRRLARSNLVMILIPVAIAAVLLLLGGGLALLLLERVWLPRLGLSFAALHETGEQLETAFAGAKALAAIYAGTVILALLATVAFTNFYLTRSLFRHISAPLQTLVAGVERIRGGNLESPIGYTAEDEFKPACDAVDAMAARLKASLDAQSRQQQRQELIAGMSHDLKSPLTSIRAYTEGLLDGVAKDEAARTRYLQTIYAKESELEALVNRLFSFAKLDLDEAPADLVPLDIAGTLQSIVDSCDAEALDVRLGELPEGRVLADRELLTRSIANLLDNSRKYGAGHAIVSAEVTAKDVCISVTDNGPGVDPAQLEKIFDLGYRTDAARQNPAGGSGIGLAVVKKSAAQMHGRADRRIRPAAARSDAARGRRVHDLPAGARAEKAAHPDGLGPDRRRGQDPRSRLRCGRLYRKAVFPERARRARKGASGAGGSAAAVAGRAGRTHRGTAHGKARRAADLQKRRGAPAQEPGIRAFAVSHAAPGTGVQPGGSV